MAKRKCNVVIIGAGFGGLRAAKGLRDVRANVVLFDRNNYHLFQPLLYQVATAALSPADIAFPIRPIFRRQKNIEIVLAEVKNIDLQARTIRTMDLEIDYDYLIVAAGATHSYFGHDEWQDLAPGLKRVDDAIEIRKRILLADEEAEHELDEASRRAKLTFVVVGGGPTGVELAGSLREIAAEQITKDYKNIDTSTARVILIDANDRVLKTFHEKLSNRALHDLQKLGVEVVLGGRVTKITEAGVEIGEQTIPANNVFWAAGVQASPLGKTLNVELDRAGRVIVGPDCAVPGHPEVFVIGDLAAATDHCTGQPLPGLAQVAMQMGAHVAKIIRQEIVNGIPRTERVPFCYHDKGTMATIGKAKAVADVHGWRFGGVIAWLLWSVVHLMFLISFRNKLSVMMNWVYNYVFDSKGARLITGRFEPRIKHMRDVTPT